MTARTLPLDAGYENVGRYDEQKVPDATFLVFGDDPEFVRLATGWVSSFGPATNAYDLSPAVTNRPHKSRAGHAGETIG
ncbi:MAG TPA: hypothetical protein VGA62_10085 [Acidimicrobiia bacterium]